MDKLIKLGGKDFKLSSSTFTIILYHSKFDRDMFQDLMELSQNKNLGGIILTLTRIIYTLAQPNLKTEQTFEEFVQELPINLFSNDKEVNKLVEVLTELMGIGDNETVPNQELQVTILQLLTSFQDFLN